MMINNRLQAGKVVSLLALLILFAGCQKSVVPVSDKNRFDSKVNALVAQTVDSCRNMPADIAPAAVISKNAMVGNPYSRLDEVIVQRLYQQLSRDRQMVALSRENWFEFSESRPLSMKGHDLGVRDLVDNLVVFIVAVEPDEVFERITVTVTAKDAGARTLPGVGATTVFDYFKDSPAVLLAKTPAQSSAVPVGLRQNPYDSLEKLCYSMASELSAALQQGVKAGQHPAPDSEFTVVLCSRNFKTPDPAFKNALIQALQQALVSMDGMTSAVSVEDFGGVFSQMDFYNQNPGRFETDFEKFKPGSVLLMAQTRDYPAEKTRQVALRAVWRVTPLVDDTGTMIMDNTAGSYVSGFTSKAWFKGPLPRVLPLEKTPPDPTVKPAQPSPSPSIDTSPDKGFD
jgi:hypothetical protein